jgi:sialic acid synthase SpsE/quercetin dioxygenase-like cupin family protein
MPMIDRDYFTNLFVLEMANNHMGDAEHGLRIIREFWKVCKEFLGDFKFAFKFQYRDLDTFIHPAYKERKEFKYVRRFTETSLTTSERKRLKDEAKSLGFITICTAFDERSVDLIEEHDYDIIKIGSCSLTDWPLLEKIVKTDKPIIASTAGASLEDIDRVVSFLEHREKIFCLMHCVGEYPTSKENLQLNQIDLLRNRYPGIPIGYSTHENPDYQDPIRIAIAKGATVFERHVGLRTDRYEMNQYSSSPEQILLWLKAARDAFVICGISGKRYEATEKEKLDLRGLQRGVFAARLIKKGERIDASNTFFAIPNFENQLVANDMSKYSEYVAKRDIGPNEPIFFGDVTFTNLRDRVLQIVRKVRNVLIESRVYLPNKVEMEISHHYGLQRFEEIGAAIINCVNREYCKKLIVMLPGQRHPVHFHRKKEETFHVLHGDVTIELNGVEKDCEAGDMVIVERGVRHSFRSKNGTVLEEISTTHYRDDSFYDDSGIMLNEQRKTALTFWSDWLTKEVT